MAQKKNNGCLIAVIATPLLIIGLGVFILLFSFIRKSDSHSQRNRHHSEAVAMQETTLIIQEDQLATIAPHQTGEILSREQFVAHLVDQRATDLMKSNFRRTAEGAIVSWPLLTTNVSESGGEITGSFELPYQVRTRGGSRGSVIPIQCVFDPSALPSLSRLRQGDWAMISGRLNLEGSSPVIMEASLIDDTPRAEAE